MINNDRIVYTAQQCQPIRTFDGHRLLKPISVSIQAGEWITLVGHNGSGKSTLARLIAGHQRSELLIEGKEDRFGQAVFPMVTQLTSQYLLGSTPYEDLIICYEQYGKADEHKHIEVIIDELLETLNLQNLKHVPMEYLSGGEKQLVAVAGALLMDTKLIVLDEVTSMLSEHNKWHVCSLIRSLADIHGIAVLWITQQLDELQASDTVWVMDKLELVYEGTAGELFRGSPQDSSLAEESLSLESSSGSLAGSSSDSRLQNASIASKLSLEIPWSVHKSIELGLTPDQYQFNPYALAEVVKRNAVAAQ